MDVIGQFLGDKATPRAKPEQHPEVMLQALITGINARFYKGATAKTWLRDQPAITLVLTWPATWLAQRGISVPVARYDGILREILNGIAQHGDTSKIKHFPTYLERCVRLWFVHNGEELYEERKRLRNVMDMRLITGDARRPAAATPDPMEAIAAAHRVLASGKKRAKTSKNDDLQASLFDA